MKPSTLFKVFALVLLLPGTFSRAAEPIHATLTVNGSVVSGDGPDGAIIALGYDHEVGVVRDPATGQSTGRRQYKPLRIVKAIDKSSPLLHKALTLNQNCALEVRFHRQSPGGKPKHYYTVTLANARITNLRQWKPNTRDLSADRAGDLEEVSFVFQTITWTWVEGDITHTDSWSDEQ